MNKRENDGFLNAEQRQFPNIINICVYSGQCPANCVHCPVGIVSAKERPQKFGNKEMDFTTFKKIADEVSDYPHSTLRIHSVGEPVLWQNLIPSIKYANEKKVRTWIFTCAITKDLTVLDNLIKYCDIVEVSVNSIDKGNYQATKGIDAYEIVYKNIEYMSERIKKLNLSTRLIVSRVESTDKNYDKAFVKYWKNSNLVADAFVRSYHSYNSLIDDRNKEAELKACLVHWARFNIDTNGDVVVCFNELFKGPKMDKTLILGNVIKKSIREIWQGEKLNIIRKAQLLNKPSLINFTNQLPCEKCTYCQPLFSDGAKSENQICQCKTDK